MKVKYQEQLDLSEYGMFYKIGKWVSPAIYRKFFTFFSKNAELGITYVLA